MHSKRTLRVLTKLTDRTVMRHDLGMGGTEKMEHAIGFLFDCSIFFRAAYTQIRPCH